VVLAPAPRRWHEDELRLLAGFSQCIERIVAPSPTIDPREEADEFIAEVYHDLRSPLQVVSLNLEYLLARAPDNDWAWKQACIGRAVRSARRMQQLVADLDEYLNGRRGADEATTRSRAAVDEVLEILRPAAEANAIRLVGDIDDDVTVRIAPRHLFRVLSNLVANAIKYAGRGTDVVVHVTRNGDRARFIVQDHGPGIAPEHCHKLFDRAWLATSPVRKGSGLGLAISRRLVETHGGTLGVVSTVGAGSSFVVELDCG
jgi:signal transduction histidine kinase